MCQDIMHGRKPEEELKHFKTTEKPFIFRGLITCGECGCLISSDRKTKPSGKEYVYFRCSHFKGNCTNPEVNENIVLQQIEKELKNLVVPSEIMKYLKKIINKMKLTTEMYYNECQNKIRRLRSLLLEGYIIPEKHCDLNEDLKNEQYKLGKIRIINKSRLEVFNCSHHNTFALQ